MEGGICPSLRAWPRAMMIREAVVLMLPLRQRALGQHCAPLGLHCDHCDENVMLEMPPLISKGLSGNIFLIDEIQ